MEGVSKILKSLHYKIKEKNFLWFIKVSFLFLITLTACDSQISKNGFNIKLKMKPVTIDGKLSVYIEGSNKIWDSDTIAIISWWNKKGIEQSQAISVINNWTISRHTIKNGYSLSCIHSRLGFSLNIEFIAKDSILNVNIPSSGIKEIGDNKIKSIRLLPYFGAAKDGEEGYLVSSKGVGTLCYFQKKDPAEYRIPVYQTINYCVMPLFGIVRGAEGIAGIITSGQYNACFNISTNWGKQHLYGIDSEFELRSFVNDSRLSDDLKIEYHFLSPDEATWIGIGRCYRQYNFEHRGIYPLKQRILKSPELAYSSEAMEVRLRLGVKPVPYKIVEQTPENEPPVRVFITFKQVRDIFDEFYRQGIKEAEFCLVGWNIGGHDGRYPQIFPVESVLGGEVELRKTIAYGQSLGYQVVSHNNHYDAYRISEDWDESYLRKKPDGSLYKGGQWGGGQSYNICLTQAYNLFARRDMPKMRELGFKGVHFSDVLSILGPRPCYDSNHPETRRQDAEATIKILSLAKKTFGGAQSEGSLDFAAPAMDRFMYIHNGESTQLKSPFVDKCIPLYPIVYHGVMLYNVSHHTLNTWPGQSKYLKNIEYGALPLNYFYGYFLLDESKNWMGDHDFRYDDKEGLKTAVSKMKLVYDDYNKIKHLQMEFIDGYEQLAEGVYETIYSNGESIVVNYNDTPYMISSDEEIPAEGFKLIKKNNLK